MCYVICGVWRVASCGGRRGWGGRGVLHDGTWCRSLLRLSRAVAAVRMSRAPGPIPRNRGVRRGPQRLGGSVTLRSKTANPQSNYYRWYWLVPQPPKPEFSSLNTHNGATHRGKCPARTAAPVAGAGHCTGCIWATAGPLHATAGSKEEPTRPSIWGSWWLGCFSTIDFR
jgi:hypothetical protein